MVRLLVLVESGLIGHVSAPDAESAIAKAIEEFKITDPQKQRRLIQLDR
jgi:hypothetical protein